MTASPRATDAPFLGVGVGLRPQHDPEILATADPSCLGVDFFEAISENYMVPGGRPLRVLEEVRAGFPLPLSYTEAALAHVAERVARVQERLGRRIALENVSSYFAYQQDAMPEWEFLARIAERADCGILLDVNNVFVSAHNHGFDPEHYLAAIPPERVFQIHLAGHSEQGSLLIDTHDHPVRSEVWSLFESTLRRIGPVSTLIEWDDHIPDLSVLVAEAARARAILARVANEDETDGANTINGRGPAAAQASHHRS